MFHARLRIVRAALLTVLIWGSAAQADPDPAQLKTMYDDALKQLQAAQDRRNELATANDQLKARVAELEQQVARQREEMRRAYYLWSNYQTWNQLLIEYPALIDRFRTFMSQGTPQESPTTQPAQVDREPWPLLDTNWPFSCVEG
ncbi:MAG: hypothetical protein QM770_08460 [Tepidisphaeraceae bacterium]